MRLRMRVVATLTALGCCALLAGPCSTTGAAQDATKGARVWTSKDGESSIRLPGAWTAEVGVGAKPDLLFLTAKTDGGVAVEIRARRTHDARTEAAALWIGVRDLAIAADAVRPAPLLHATQSVPAADGEPAIVAVHTTKRVRRTIYWLTATAPADQAEPLRSALAATLRTFDTRLADPGPPPEFRRSTKGVAEFFVHPAVKEGDAARVQSLAIAALTAWAQRNVAIPAPADDLVRVVIHPDAASADEAVPGSTAAALGMDCDWGRGEFHTAVFDTKDERLAAEFAARIGEVAHAQTFGTSEPCWLHRADTDATFSERLAGRPLPVVAESMYSFRMPGEPVPFRKMVEDEHAQADSRRWDRLMYLGLLREGPPKVQAAFKAMLQSLADRGDPVAAMQPLLDMDQTKMQEDVVRFLARLKQATGK